jgi:ribonucleoside-triphosphate reductase
LTTLSDYQTFIHLTRYARFDYELGRRETFEETVDRYLNFWESDQLDLNTKAELREAMLNLDVAPSMRALWSAGPALARDSMCAYNCAFIAVDHPLAFSEALLILMSGSGLGFSVEEHHIAKMPEVAETMAECDVVIKVADSKKGWGDAYKQLIGLLYSGSIPTWDLSSLRGAGERLKTMGGRASGPKPLDDLFNHTVHVFKEHVGKRLSSEACHSLMNMCGQCVVVGGVRRSALISLGSHNDARHRDLKMGNWYDHNGHYALSNNSAVYNEKPSFNEFQQEWLALYQSYSGERGFFNREGAKKKIESLGTRDPNFDFGCNPCAEILLRPSGGLCNLTEVCIRPDDTLEKLRDKVRLCTVMGTLQATLVNFKGLRSSWTRNAVEERLLGVSFSGIADHPVMNGRKGHGLLKDWLTELRQLARDVNAEWAAALDINPAAAITTIKPSGTVSQLYGTGGSGIHAAFSKHYIRTVRQDNKDPMTAFMKDAGVPNEPCVMNPETTTVFSFPMKAPSSAVVNGDMTPIESLELAKLYNTYWADHSVSLTVYYNDSNFLDVGSWVWANWGYMTGMSFLPEDGGTYAQAPYQKIDAKQYAELSKAMPKIDWGALAAYEQEDNTQGAQTLACVAGSCELV